MTYSEKIAGCVENYLKEQDYSYDYDTFHGTFAVEAELSCKLHSCLVVLQITQDAVLSYAALSVDVNPRLYAEVGEFLHRANYGLPNGNFEFNYDDGSIHFKTFIDCPDETPTHKQLEDCFAVPLTVIDHYGDALLKLLGGQTSLSFSVIRELDERQ